MSGYVPKYPGPIQVAADVEGRHFADGPLDRRLQLGPLNGMPSPDIVVMRGWRSKPIGAMSSVVPNYAFRRIIAGEAILVLDASGEGPAFESFTASTIHKTLRDLGVPASRTVYLTQNRAWAEVYRGFCYAMGVEPVHVLHYDYYIRNVFREHETDGEEVFAKRLAAFEARAGQREKRFVCLNFTSRPAKVLLLLKLIAGGQYDQGFVSYPGFDKTINERATKRSAAALELLSLPGLEAIAAELMPHIETLAGKGSAMFGARDAAAVLAEYHNPLASETELDEYNRAWFSVVNESEVYGRRRITEKPFKPLANFSPYITFGNPGSLDLVHSFGFRTFGEAIDESYDAELDLRRRFLMIYDEIARLCALPEPALRDVEAALTDTLVFNARHALIEMPRRYREVLEPQLVDALMDIRNTPARPAGG